ncbi:MAG: ArnT family glycosyltransferase [Salibacteraceae bacterium]
MENLIFDIFTVLVVVILNYMAFGSVLGKNRNLEILCIVISGLILMVYMSTDFYLHEWDERYHALVAKNIIENPLKPMLYSDPVLPFDIKQWASNHIWLHKQPVPLWSMGLSMAVFGVNEIALRLPSIVLFSLSVYVMFLLGKELFSYRVGKISALLFAINGIILEVGSGRIPTDHIDLFFLCFVLFSVYNAVVFFKRRKSRYNLLFGFCLGFAILSKWLPALIVVPIWIMLSQFFNTYTKKELFVELVKALAIVCMIVIPWQWYAITEFPQEYLWESTYNLLHITEVLSDQGGSWFYHFEKLRINYGELVYLPVLWFLYKTVKQKKDFRYWAISIWFIVPYIFFSFVATKMQGYTMFAAPAVFLIIAIFIEALINKEALEKHQWITKTIVILLIALPIRFSIERMKPFTQRERTPRWVNSFKNFERNTKKEKNVVFNISRPIEFMFYTSHVAYRKTPTVQEVTSIVNKGYRVVINGKLENYPMLSKLNEIQFIEIVN